jgi:hypothetical protein
VFWLIASAEGHYATKAFAESAGEALQSLLRVLKRLRGGSGSGGEASTCFSLSIAAFSCLPLAVSVPCFL